MNRHGSAGNHETNSQSHHELQEEIAQLKERERVLVSENDQLRAQLVEMKEEAHKKYDDLMVQYNMKREYEDGTSNNQVTVKTEWDDEEVKVEIKEEIKEEEDQDIIIKREFVSAYVKTKSSDVKVEIKEEIKEEDDEDDRDEDSGWDRCLVKKELNTADMIEVKEEVEDGEETRIIDMETLTEDRQVKREIEQEENEMTLHNDQIGHWVKREEIKEKDEEEVNETTNKEEMLDVKEEEDDGHNRINGIEGWTPDDLVGGDESEETSPMDTISAQPTGQSQLTVTQSADLLSPSTSTAQDETSPTELNQQATASTGRNGNKRKQSTSNRFAKKSRQTIEDRDDDEEDGEDIADDDRKGTKVKVLHLNCTQSNCNVKLDSLVHLHDHLSTVHRLAPLRCFATNCYARFDNKIQIREHIKVIHPQDTRFLCAVCPKECDSQTKAYTHWYQNHQTGQFKCNFVSDCGEVCDTRRKMTTHQQAKHYSQSKHLYCTHPGCTASFAFKVHLKQHELNHLESNQFHCNWPNCNNHFKLRTNLVKHIRTKHFGLPKSMKAQKEKNIVDLRDPNEYVRVVVDE